jgi:quinol monooxygenase YgiN
MLRFRLRMEFTPEAIDEALQVLRSLVGPVRAEPGCSATRLLRDVDEWHAVTFVEEWRDPESLQRHLQGSSFRKILAVIELAATAPTVEIDSISSRRGFDLVEEVLGRGPADASNAGGAVGRTT